MSLTPKKRRFIDALREGASNRDAAIAAGCSEKTASAAGSRLAKDPDVVAELHKLNTLGPTVKGVKGKPPETGPEVEHESTEPAGFDLAAALTHRDPKDFLLAVMNDMGSDAKLRVDAAKALMPYVHQRRGESGKKEQAQEKAEQISNGRFGPRQPPKLKAVPGGKP